MINNFFLNDKFNIQKISHIYKENQYGSHYW